MSQDPEKTEKPELLTGILYDATQTGRKNWWLSTWWGLGSRLFGDFDVRLPVRSWSEGYERLEEIKAMGLQFRHFVTWTHGGPAEILVNREEMEIARMAAVLPLAPGGVFWPRGCNVIAGTIGQAYAIACTRHLAGGRARFAGFTHIVSGDEHGNPTLRSVLYQSGLYGLRPGETPHWSTDDRGGSSRREPNTITIFDHVIPDWAWQPRKQEGNLGR